MPFDFGRPSLPITLRVCRALVWTQGAFVLLVGTFVVLAVTVFGQSNLIPFGGQALSGGRAAALGVIYVAAGMALLWLGVALGRLSMLARNLIICAQVFLAVLLFARDFALSVSVFTNVTLYVAIVALLFTPSARAALEAPASPATSGSPAQT